jgi:hypothetical protein
MDLVVLVPWTGRLLSTTALSITNRGSRPPNGVRGGAARLLPASPLEARNDLGSGPLAQPWPATRDSFRSAAPGRGDERRPR